MATPPGRKRVASPVARPTPRAPRIPSALEVSDAESWVFALADVVEGKSAALQLAPVPADSDVARAHSCFGLYEVEIAALTILAAAERSFAVARRLGQLSGTGHITVGLLRELLRAAGLAGLTERLAPTRALDRHALVARDGVRDRHCAADDVIRLEVGLVPSLPLGAESDAYELIEPQAETNDRPGWVQRASAGVPLVLQLDSNGREAARVVAHALSDCFSRSVLCAFAADVGTGHAARLRRDVDLAGAILLLVAPSIAALRAALVAPPVRPVATPVIVVVERVVDDEWIQAPWIFRRDKVGGSESRGASTAGNPTPLDYIRELAQRDADRALGIIRPQPKPRPVVPGHVVDARQAAPKAETPPQPAPVFASEPSVVSEMIAEPATAAETASEAKPAPVVEVAPVPPPAPSIAVPVAAPPVDDSPRLELPADAKPDLIAAAAMQSPSASQRVELMDRLAGIKSPKVVAALRHNARSEHPQVRSVAERLMTQLFGPSWNVSRAIAPPVQPPSTEE